MIKKKKLSIRIEILGALLCLKRFKPIRLENLSKKVINLF